jgi:F5/8 type C domain.
MTQSKKMLMSVIFCSAGPQLAVDGNANPDLHADYSCTHTHYKTEQWYPWWELELHAVTAIESVRITNRDSCGGPCDGRLDGFSISVDGVECASNQTIPSGETGTVPCAATGRRVRIWLPSKGPDPAPLTLCEVVVVEATPWTVGALDR